MFCPIPWQNFHVKHDGCAYLCCEDWLPTPIGNLLELPAPEGIKSLWTSPTATEIRSSILDQSFKFCTRCPYLPVTQGPRGPVSTFTPHNNVPVSNSPDTLVLDHDRTCNLACPSCRGGNSQELIDPSLSRRLHETILQSGLVQSINRLYVSGSGDPIASPLYKGLLLDLPSLCLLPNFQITLHTNGQLLDAEAWKNLGPARDLITGVGISIDAGTPETYAINRGASWTRLWENVKFLRNLVLPSLGMYYVVQSNNFRELPTLVELATNNGVNFISIIFLRNWGTYTSAEYKDRAVHLPDHPDYVELSRVIESLSQHPNVILPSFPVSRSIATTEGPRR